MIAISFLKTNLTDVVQRGVEQPGLSSERQHDHDVDDDQDEAPEAQAQGHVVQGPGCSAVPFCSLLVPDVVGFTGLRGRRGGGWLATSDRQQLYHLLFTDVITDNRGVGIKHRCAVESTQKEAKGQNFPPCLLLIHHTMQ